MMRVLAGSVSVGDYITTEKRDQWWKVESIRHSAVGITTIRYFQVVNKAGYRKEITADPGTGRRFYRWIPQSQRSV